MLFKGRLFLKQFIPNKRHRFGIKIFVLCDCETGYVLDFHVYTGSSINIEEHNLGKSGDFIATLISPYLNKGHRLFVDNWYTSPVLFSWLYNRATNACGTVRRTRKEMPKMEERLKKGELTFRTSKELISIKWCDKREVWMLSTFHEPGFVKTGKIDRITGV
ncbi:hypothetical protein J437_LFUL005005 [Ladona fulva]|uniref:PiggyBac transposable element-derived protein domain-containing protein n=1 Tax=Ladona fulva TaxID=123851 RepID=A0A8K0NWY0_LADFU|nr:hypothetical protein J437_LFUL005005 [Ladona fulva]